jgi:hypothetical protein
MSLKTINNNNVGISEISFAKIHDKAMSFGK